MQLPNFLVVGAPRSGTTSIYEYLSEHPEIYLPVKKELHYFTHDYLAKNSNGPKDMEMWYCKTLDEYKTFFQTIPSSARAVGDVSPSYLFFPECIPKIKELLGEDVKIIMILRNPIERAFSNYLHMVRLQRETLNFFDALNAEEERLAKGWRNIWLYKRHSLYYEKVKRYIEEFGSSKVKVVLHDDFANNTLETMQDVYRFLDVAAEFVPKNINIIYGKSGSYKNRLVEFLIRPHPIKSFAKPFVLKKVLRIVKNFQVSHIGHNMKTEILQDDHCIAFLQQYFKKNINQLEHLLQVDLSMWK